MNKSKSNGRVIKNKEIKEMKKIHRMTNKEELGKYFIFGNGKYEIMPEERLANIENERGFINGKRYNFYKKDWGMKSIRIYSLDEIVAQSKAYVKKHELHIRLMTDLMNDGDDLNNKYVKPTDFGLGYLSIDEVIYDMQLCSQHELVITKETDESLEIMVLNRRSPIKTEARVEKFISINKMIQQMQSKIQDQVGLIESYKSTLEQREVELLDETLDSIM